MLSAHEGSRVVADWMELDYVKRRRRFRKVKTFVLWLALAAAVLFLGYTYLPGKAAVFQAARVSPAHALWQDDCGQCHRQSFRTGARFVSLDEHVRSVPDEACTTCHAGPAHQSRQVYQPACVLCHREHHGRPLLSAVEDSQCTQCHADLKTNDGQPRFHAHIHSFASDHPAFQKREDPGTIRFNHARHLDLKPEAIQEQFKEARTELPKLKSKGCEYCHQAADVVDGQTKTDRERKTLDRPERYMLPIRYDKHCQTCHPLTVESLGDRPIPHPEHGESARTVHALLLEWFLVRSGESRLPPAVTPGQVDRANADRATAERVLFNSAGGCRYCHCETSQPSSRNGGLPEYAPPQINLRWFTHSKFSHSSHRFLDCTKCHHDAPTSKLTSDVLLPTMDICRECHAPGSGAKSDCAECHLYHDHVRDHRLTGPFAGQEGHSWRK
jgi:hypothetical protein